MEIFQWLEMAVPAAQNFHKIQFNKRVIQAFCRYSNKITLLTKEFERKTGESRSVVGLRPGGIVR